MAYSLFISATNTSIGKTYTTLQLMAAASKAGLRVAAFKPIETGVIDHQPADGTALLKAMQYYNPHTHDLTIETVVPIRYRLGAAPFVAKGDAAIEWEKIHHALHRLQRCCDILFVEGAGGLMVPIDVHHFMIDLPCLLGLDATLLVAPGGLGSINDTLLSLEALHRRRLTHYLAINLKEKKEKEAFAHLTMPYYSAIDLTYRLIPKQADQLLKDFGIVT